MAEPVLWRAGLWEFRGQHLLQLLALLGGVLIAAVAARGAGLGWPLLRDAALWSLPEALLAARLGHIALHLDLYLLAPARVWHLWDGGYALGAGLLAGGAALWLFARRHASLGWHLADVAAVGLAAGQLVLAAGTLLAPATAAGLATLALYATRLAAMLVAAPLSAASRPTGALLLIYLVFEGAAVLVRAAVGGGADPGWAIAAWATVATAAGLLLLARHTVSHRIER